jgi:hypothetical protein
MNVLPGELEQAISQHSHPKGTAMPTSAIARPAVGEYHPYYDA